MDHCCRPVMKPNGRVFIKFLFLSLSRVCSLGDINRCRKDPIMFAKRQFPLTWLYLRICTSGPDASVSQPIYDHSGSFFFTLTLYLSPQDTDVYFCHETRLLSGKTLMSQFEIHIRFMWVFCSLILDSVLIAWPLDFKRENATCIVGVLQCEAALKHCFSPICHCGPSAGCKQLTLTVS